MRKMIQIFLLSILTLFQATACDSGGSGDPDIRGTWNGSAILPNAPFPIAMNFNIDITSKDISGTGSFQLEFHSVFRTTDIVITGTYDFPNVTLRFASDSSRVDVFTGTVDKDALILSGDLQVEKMALPELGRTSRILNALGGKSELLLFRGGDN